MRAVVALLWLTFVAAAAGAFGGPSLDCAVLSARELHRHGRHAFLCANLLSGELQGAFLRRNGVVVCQLTGTVDLQTGCAVVTGCGLDARTCAEGP